MTSLYPPIEPFNHGWLKADDIHEVYWEECGNPAGVPIVMLHGGPGAGCAPKHRQLFDPDFFRIILLDQRGAGRSKPVAEIRNNTTQLLIDDIEALRCQLEIERWHVFGGSWGSTLALAYAQEHPRQVLSLTLRGIFTMRLKEIDSFLYGMKSIFPEAWHAFANHLPENERGNLLENYFKRLTSSDEKTVHAAAKAWTDYEMACSTLLPTLKDNGSPYEAGRTLALARIEAHYFRSCLFSPEDRLLKNVSKLRHIPATIIQGRYDMVCPFETAYELHQLWPEAKFVIVPDAGHSAFEPGILQELINATNALKDSAETATPMQAKAKS